MLHALAERALHEESLDSHTARWQQVLDMTTRGAEEEIEQERTNNVELANDLNNLRLQLQEAEVQLKEWDDSYDSGVFAQRRRRKQERKRRQEPRLLPPQNLLCLLLPLLQLYFTILFCHPDIYPLPTRLFAF